MSARRPKSQASISWSNQTRKKPVQHWARQRRIRIDYTQPGKPQQNTYVECYNRTMSYNWLSQTLLSFFSAAQDATMHWL